MTGKMKTPRQPLEKTAREAPNSFPKEEILHTDCGMCIPFSVRGARSWDVVTLRHPARIELYSDDKGHYKIDGGVFMNFPKLDYVDNGEGLRAVLGDPKFE